MIARIVATQRGTGEQLNIEIHWQSGPVRRDHVGAPVRRLEQLPSHEALRRRILELHKEGTSHPETSGTLNAEGYRPQKQGIFSSSSVTNLLNKCRPSPNKDALHPKTDPFPRSTGVVSQTTAPRATTWKQQSTPERLKKSASNFAMQNPDCQV